MMWYWHDDAGWAGWSLMLFSMLVFWGLLGWGIWAVLRVGPGTGAAERSPEHAERTVYSNASGTPFVESWTIKAGPHAWSGGDAAGSFTDPHGPNASQAMVAFFLQHRR